MSGPSLRWHSPAAPWLTRHQYLVILPTTFKQLLLFAFVWPQLESTAAALQMPVN